MATRLPMKNIRINEPSARFSNGRLRDLAMPGNTCFRLVYSFHYYYAITTFSIITRDHHPRYEEVKRRWESRTDPLWWQVFLTKKVGGTKKVVRGMQTRKARHAWIQALKNAGYKETGEKITGEGEKAMEEEDGLTSDLAGTVQILIKEGMLRARRETVDKDAAQAVEVLKRAVLKERRLAMNTTDRVSPLAKKD